MFQGNKLRGHREAAGLSRERLAALAGCSTSTITQAERGAVVSDMMGAKLAAALRCGVADLGEVVS